MEKDYHYISRVKSQATKFRINSDELLIQS